MLPKRTDDVSISSRRDSRALHPGMCNLALRSPHHIIAIIGPPYASRHGSTSRTGSRINLDSYPQWYGQIKGVDSNIDPDSGDLRDMPTHARRPGRVHVQYGGDADVGVEFVSAKCDSTLDAVHPRNPPADHKGAVWTHHDLGSDGVGIFAPQCDIAKAFEPSNSTEEATSRVLLHAQYTSLACGGYAIGIKIVRPLADAATVSRFMSDWTDASRLLVRSRHPTLSSTKF